MKPGFETPTRARRAHALGGVVTLLWLTGCAQWPGAHAPASAEPPAPPASLAAHWVAPLPHAGQPTDLAAWWQQLQAPALPALITAAQAASPSLASATARVERARAARVAAVAAGQPWAQLNGGLSTGRASPGAPTTTSANLGVQAGWELDLFGAVAAGRQAAQARLEGAQAGWHQARVAVAAETASTYTALRHCEAQRALAQVDSHSRAETTRLTEASAKAGFTAPGDAALARASAAQGRSTLLNLAAQCEGLVKALVELTDIPEPTLRTQLAPAIGALPRPQPIATAALPASLLTQRPDVVDATRAVLAAAAEAQQASAREKPQVSLSGSLGGLMFRTPNDTQSGAVWSLGPLSITLPLLDGGARAAATAAARAGYDEAVAQYRAQVRRAVREVETPLVALAATAQRQADADAAARDFELAFRATEARQRGGLASLFELEAARRNTVQAQAALLDLQRERVDAWISLYRALGGGWSPGATP